MRGILLLAMVAACGGDDDADPLTPGQAEALCDDYCTACDPDSAECRPECEEDATDRCANGDAFRTIVECLEENGCSLDEVGECLGRVMPTAAHERWAEACRDKLAECGETSGEIADQCDLDDVKYFSSVWADQARECFEEECAAIEACLDASRDSC
jgi:hypothetical protein